MHIKEVQKSLGFYTLDSWNNAVTVRRDTWKLTRYCFNDTFHTDGYKFNNASLFYICATLLCKCSILFPKPSREIPTTMKRIHYDNACTSRVVQWLSNIPYLVRFASSNSLIITNIENTITNRIVRIIETWTWFTEWPQTSYVRLNNGNVYLHMTAETPRGKTCNWIVNCMKCRPRLKLSFISRLFMSMLE